jgi:hypothetical protein
VVEGTYDMAFVSLPGPPSMNTLRGEEAGSLGRGAAGKFRSSMNETIVIT